MTVTSSTIHPGTPIGALLLAVRHHLTRVARSDRGASAVEWVVITATIVGIAVAVGAILFATIQGSAEQIQVPVDGGGGAGGGGGGGGGAP